MIRELDGDLTPAEQRALKHFAANYLAGRRFACWLFRAIVALGALGGAIYGISQGLSTVAHVAH